MTGLYDRIVCGNGGWVRFERDSLPGLVVYVRYEDSNGKLVPVEEVLLRNDGAPLAAADSHAVPRRRITAWVNALPDLREKLVFPAPDVRRAIAHHATTRFVTSYSSAPDWVALMFAAQVKDSGVPQPPMPRDDRGGSRQVPEPDFGVPSALRPAQRRMAKFVIPEGSRYSDDFYASVRQTRDALDEAGEQAPARLMAEVNDVPYTRVRDWLRTADSLYRTGKKRPTG